MSKLRSYTDRLAIIDDIGSPLARSFEDYLRTHVFFTGSGILSQRCVRWTKDIVGAERILYASDYLYIETGQGKGRAFIDESPELTDPERDAIAHATGNA